MLTSTIISAPLIGPPTDIEDNSMHNLAVLTNDVGAILHKKGQATVALRYYQDALKFLMESLRDPAGEGSRCQSEDVSQRIISIRQDMQKLHNAEPRQRVPALDMYPRDGSRGDELDVTFLPLTRPIELSRRRRKALAVSTASTESSYGTAPEDDQNNSDSAVILLNMSLAHMHAFSFSKASQLLTMATSLPKASVQPAVKATIYKNLAIAQYGQSMYFEATKTLKEAYGLLERAETEVARCSNMFELDIATEKADTLSMLGRIHYLDGQQDEALAMCYESLRIRRRACGDNDVQVAAVLYNIGLIHQEQEHTQSAIDHCTWFVNHPCISSLPEYTPLRAEAMHTIAVLHLAFDRVSGSVQAFKDTVELRRRAHGPIHPSLSDDLLQLGRVLHDSGRHEEAMASYREALEIEVALAPSANPTIPSSSLSSSIVLDSEGVATVLCSMGHVHQSMGQFDAALEAYEKVLEVARATFGDNDEFIASMLNIIGNLHLERGETEDALANFADSARISQILRDTGDTTGQESTSNISLHDPVVVLNLINGVGVEFHPHAAAA